MNGALAQRYAAALTDVALGQNRADQVKRGLTAFVGTLSESADLRNFLESPRINGEVKRRAIEAIAQRMGLDSAVRNFLFVIVDHRRTEMLHEIEEAFRSELNARLGIAEAEVVSARPLSAAERDQLKAALERRTGKKIEADFREDKALLGGAVVRVGSTVYDGSVREQLDRLREQLEME